MRTEAAPPLSDRFFPLSFQAMGTGCRVDFESPSHAAAEDFKKGVVDWVNRFEAKFSRFVPDSLVSRINRSAGREWVQLDEEGQSLVALCDWFHWATRGIFDPTSLPVVALWDYHAANPGLPDEGVIRRALSRVGWRKLQRRGNAVFLPEEGMGIDLGGIGKEYAVDRVLEMALGRGIRNVVVNFGHDLRVHGEPPEGGPWRIGLEDPNDPGRCWGGVAVRDRAVTTSGDYLRHFTAGGVRYGHILDPRTGHPVNNGCRAVSVIAPTCTEAGILSTTAFILGAREGLEFLDGYYQAEGCIWHQDQRIETRRFDEYLIRS